MSEQTAQDQPIAPTIKVGDWIETTNRKWARVRMVYDHEPGIIECSYVSGSNGKAYKRDFQFRDGWWRFRYPDPDGGYFPHGQERTIAKELTEGPPFKFVGLKIEYLDTKGDIWRCPPELIERPSF